MPNALVKTNLGALLNELLVSDLRSPLHWHLQRKKARGWRKDCKRQIVMREWYSCIYETLAA